MRNEEAADLIAALPTIDRTPVVSDDQREALRMAIAALRSPAPGAVAMREAAAKVAENPYSDAVEAFGPDEPMAVGRKIAAAIRALPAPEVPEAVKAWVASYDDEATAGAHHLAVDDAIREWIRQEYGL